MSTARTGFAYRRRRYGYSYGHGLAGWCQKLQRSAAAADRLMTESVPANFAADSRGYPPALTADVIHLPISLEFDEQIKLAYTTASVQNLYIPLFDQLIHNELLDAVCL